MSFRHAIDGQQLIGHGHASDRALRQIGREIGLKLPSDYLAFAAEIDGLEGWLGGSYVALWQVERLREFNELAETATYAEGLVLFGTNGAGDGYGFDTREGQALVVTVPMVGLRWDRAEETGRSFSEFLEALESVPWPGGTPKLNPALLGKNIHEIQPVLLGGSPTDPANKVVLPVEDYLRLTTWWNRQIDKMGGVKSNAPD
jgi:SMI1 / KNR4 family (SUKH-1)